MKLGFAAGDIGGARALIPVIDLAVKKGFEVSVLSHGAIVNEKSLHRDKWQFVSSKTYFSSLKFDAFAFSSSTHDYEPIDLARNLRQKKVPVLHLLDHWSNYKNRLSSPNGPLLTPNVYAVMDKISAEKVISAGFNKKIVKITGSPALSNIKRIDTLNTNGPVIFVSEPISEDYKNSKKKIDYRGYSEIEVLDLLLEIRTKIMPNNNLWIYPHPREKKDNILKVLAKHNLTKKGSLVNIVKENQRNNLLRKARGIVGMSSIFLYECWLAGYPILSIQPNLQNSLDHFFLNKPGVEYCLETKNLKNIFSKWYNFDYKINDNKKMATLELKKHKQAAKNVLQSIINMI